MRSDILVSELHKRNILVLSQVKNNQCSSNRYWISADILNLPFYVVDEWNNYTISLSHVGKMLEDRRDSIVWDLNKRIREVIAKLSYNVVVEDWIQEAPKWW